MYFFVSCRNHKGNNKSDFLVSSFQKKDAHFMKYAPTVFSDLKIDFDTSKGIYYRLPLPAVEENLYFRAPRP